MFDIFILPNKYTLTEYSNYWSKEKCRGPVLENGYGDLLGGQLQIEDQDRAFKMHAEKVGVDGLSFNNLDHTFSDGFFSFFRSFEGNHIDG